MPNDEFKLIQRKMGELYLLMTRLNVFNTVDFAKDLGPKDMRKWIELRKALKKWVDNEDS